MTATTAPLCGHRWYAVGVGYTRLGVAKRRRLGCGNPHICDRPVDLGHPGPCRCRCGATSTREDTDR